MSEQLPRRRVTCKISIGADSAEDVRLALAEILDNINDGILSSVMGGSTVGWMYNVNEDESITHDSYFEAVAAHKAARELAEQ